MVVTENLLSLHLSCPSVPVIENFKVSICPSVPVTGISKSVFVPVTKGSRMTSLHMSKYFPVSQYFPEYYQHCLIRHLQISLWKMIRQLLSQCLFWERTHFPSISHYSQRFSEYYHHTYWECFNWDITLHHCDLVIQSSDITSWILVNIGLGNGLLPDGTKPLPEPILIYHQWERVAFTWGQFHRNDIYLWYDFENNSFKITATSLGGGGCNELKMFSGEKGLVVICGFVFSEQAMTTKLAV